jgi:hypothetical protein
VIGKHVSKIDEEFSMRVGAEAVSITRLREYSQPVQFSAGDSHGKFVVEEELEVGL